MNTVDPNSMQLFTFCPYFIPSEFRALKSHVDSMLNVFSFTQTLNWLLLC